MSGIEQYVSSYTFCQPKVFCLLAVVAELEDELVSREAQPISGSVIAILNSHLQHSSYHVHLFLVREDVCVADNPCLGTVVGTIHGNRRHLIIVCKLRYEVIHEAGGKVCGVLTCGGGVVGIVYVRVGRLEFWIHRLAALG